MIDIIENKVLGPAIPKGEATMLAALLEERFGVLPDWVSEKPGNGKEAELLAWGKRVLFDKSLAEVFRD